MTNKKKSSSSNSGKRPSEEQGAENTSEGSRSAGVEISPSHIVQGAKRSIASLEQFLEKEQEHGRLTGFLWSTGSASATGLCLLALANWQDDSEDPPFSLAEKFYFITHSGDKGDCAAATRFWEDVGIVKPTDTFVRGFTEGALEGWIELLGLV